MCQLPGRVRPQLPGEQCPGHRGRALEFRLEEVTVRAGSRLAGRTLREANVSETTGALVLALRDHDGTFLANPPMQTPIDAGYVLIAIGTQQQLSALQHAADQVG
jgi:voltage-gated potassium channel